MTEHFRILFEGERWLGSNAASSCRALRRLGHTVADVDFSTYIPTMWTSLPLRAARRLLMPFTIREHNRMLARMAREFRPHIFLAFKGNFVLPETLLQMRSLGIALYNFYPDVSVFTHRASFLPRSLQEYDCIFSTKRFTRTDMEEHGFPLRHCEYLPHGYDPDAHHPVEVNQDEVEIYAADAVFIGTHSPGKERTLSELKSLRPDLKLIIWGNGWERSRSPVIGSCIKGRAVEGMEYMKALCGAKIVLALLNEKVEGASRGDEITSRTFNIPAARSFMIHWRSEEVLKFYQEGREIECCSTIPELAEKVDHYLANPEQREAVAEAGYRRTVPAYSQDNRMKVIIDRHREHSGNPAGDRVR